MLFYFYKSKLNIMESLSFNLCEKMSNWCYLLLLTTLLFSCEEKEDLFPVEEKLEKVLTKGAYNDGSFEWDRINHIVTQDQYNATVSIPLPWEPGGTQSAGIPSDWIDAKAESSNTSERYYSRENGWKMVYSNMNRNTPNKYFALYNENTGILRFFFYSIANSSGAGTTSTFVGLNIDKSSSLFNFTDVFATGINNKKNYPAYIFSPGWSVGVNNMSIGFKENNWYAIEIECAYDPDMQDGSNFTAAVWAANVTTSFGKAITNGQITGSITSSASNMPDLTLNLGSINTINNFSPDKNSTSIALGDTIEAGIKKNDSFFLGLWNDLKGGITKWIGTGVTSGVKEGIKSVISSGGSVAAKVLGNVLNSIIGGNNNQVNKVDLTMSSKSEISVTSSMQVLGWGRVSPFPMPGSKSTDAPLYDIPLGIWNLKSTPVVNVIIFRDLYYPNSTSTVPTKCNYSYNYNLMESQVIINKAFQSKLAISNFKEELIINESSKGVIDNLLNSTPYAFLQSQKYYRIANSVRSKYFTMYNFLEPDSYFWNHAMSPKFLVRISFDLTNTDTGKIYSYSKYFDVIMKKGNMINTKYN